MAEPLRMARVPLDGAALVEVARRRGLPSRDLDLGYAAHCALTELFGDLAPRPFALQPTVRRWQPVLGYTSADAAGLRARAELGADPWMFERVVDWAELATKPMPATWSGGQRLGFRVETVPVARAAKGYGQREAGAEVDVFLLRCREAGDGARVDREAVYREWLSGQLARHGGARVTELRVEAYKRERFTRRTQGEGRKSHVCEWPKVTFRGALEVTDPAGFDALLRRGVGRHRAFGLGMLLLSAG